MNKKLFHLILAATCVALLCSFTPPKKLYKGWYSVKKLQRMGYTVPAGTKKHIYVRNSKDTAIVNIKPLCK
jgi:hypothetical protein